MSREPLDLPVSLSTLQRRTPQLVIQADVAGIGAAFTEKAGTDSAHSTRVFFPLIFSLITINQATGAGTAGAPVTYDSGTPFVRARAVDAAGTLYATDNTTRNSTISLVDAEDKRSSAAL